MFASLTFVIRACVHDAIQESSSTWLPPLSLHAYARLPHLAGAHTHTHAHVTTHKKKLMMSDGSSITRGERERANAAGRTFELR